MPENDPDHPETGAERARQRPGNLRLAHPATIVDRHFDDSKFVLQPRITISGRKCDPPTVIMPWIFASAWRCVSRSVQPQSLNDGPP